MSFSTNLKIDSLESVSIETLTNAICIAFADYSVKMPSDPMYWKSRFAAARVDYKLSQGIYNKNELIAFVINAVDLHEGVLTAYNTGTGVFSAHRGNRYIDKIYDYAIPLFKELLIKKCALEVIVENERAIKVYNRIGFQKTKVLKSYAGTLPDYDVAKIDLKEFKLDQISTQVDPGYSWDFKKTTILKLADKYRAFRVYKSAKEIGYFVIREDNGTLAQYEVTDNDWELLFTGIAKVLKTIKINNIDSIKGELIAYLKSIDFPNPINQYEMEMML